MKGSESTQTPPLKDLFDVMRERQVVGRAFDNKAGLFIAAETLRCLAEQGGLHPDVGVARAKTAAFHIAPRTGVAVDMGVAMDYPRARPEDQGKLDLGQGPGQSQAPTPIQLCLTC